MSKSLSWFCCIIVTFNEVRVYVWCSHPLKYIRAFVLKIPRGWEGGYIGLFITMDPMFFKRFLFWLAKNWINGPWKENYNFWGPYFPYLFFVLVSIFHYGIIRGSFSVLECVWASLLYINKRPISLVYHTFQYFFL